MPQQNWNNNWKDLRSYLLAVHDEYQDRNGLDFCKNCEVNHLELVADIESIIPQQRKELIEEILKEAPEDFPEETNPELQHEVLAEIIGTKLENFNEGYNQCNKQWRELIKSKLEI